MPIIIGIVIGATLTHYMPKLANRLSKYTPKWGRGQVVEVIE